MADELLSGKTADKTTVGEFRQKIELVANTSAAMITMTYPYPLA